MSDNKTKWFSLNLNSKNKQTSGSSCGCGKSEGGCNSHQPKEDLSAEEFLDAAVNASIGEEVKKDGFDQVFDVKMDRRSAFKQLTASLLIGAGAVSSCTSVTSGKESKEKAIEIILALVVTAIIVFTAFYYNTKNDIEYLKTSDSKQCIDIDIIENRLNEKDVQYKEIAVKLDYISVMLEDIRDSK